MSQPTDRMIFELTDTCPKDYADVFARSTATAFQHPVWVDRFVRDLAPGRDARTLFVTARDGDRLIGVLALTLRRMKGLRLLEAFDLGVCDYIAPVLDRDADMTVMGVAMRDLLPAHDIFRVNNLRPTHLRFWEALTGNAPEAAGFSAHATKLDGTFVAWRKAALDRSMASQTLRKGKKWARDANVTCERVPASQAAAAVGALADLRAGRFDGDPIQTDCTRAFYAGVAEDGSDGFCEVWCLSADGETAGLLLGVTHESQFHYLLIGCDYDRFGKHSPGQQLYERVIEDWMGRGGTAFDFTIGDEAFKAKYGTEATPMARASTAATLRGRVGLMVLERRAA